MRASVVFISCALLLLGSSVSGRKGFGEGEQEWGFAEVRPGAHMFWWFYYATEPVDAPEDVPILIWLQGGPGASSTGYGNFMEIGPLDSNLQERPDAWTKKYNVLFIDNPVGTGFSWVESSSLLARDNAQIAADLVECLNQVLSQLPSKFRSTPIHIMSESYGGKMTAEFGLALYKAIKSGKVNANLAGVGLGDSWISPIDSVMTWGPYLLQLGLVDNAGYKTIMSAANRTLRAVQAGRWSEATDEWGRTEGVVSTVTHGVDFYNVLTKIGYQFGSKNWKPVLPGVKPRDGLNGIMNNQVRKALDIPSTIYWSESSGTVFQALSGDFMKPVTDIVERLLNETDIGVCVYSGQLDLIVDTPGTYDWVYRLKWPGRSSWDRASRNVLAADGVIQGYSKVSGRFSMYWVDRAGHMVPADNPPAMHEILRQITKPAYRDPRHRV